MRYALFPERAGGTARLRESKEPPERAFDQGVRQCEPQAMRGGLDRFLDESGELRVVFVDCLGFAAPFVLFRLKRQGFSRCVVRVTERGLCVEARR